MLFNSFEFIVFFAVVGMQFFRAAAIIRWPVTLIGVAYPILQSMSETGGDPTATAIAATVLIALFLGVVVFLRLQRQEATARKVLLTTASLLFYSAWRWPFTILLLFSTVMDYTCAREIHRTTDAARRRFFLVVSMVGNLGMLAVFKYTNFILENVETLLGVSGLQVDIPSLGIILPLGISFYTFQTMSYTIDVFRGQCEPRQSILDVALYVSFFPQLVAGPILRASQFLPQLDEEQKFDAERAKAGILLMLWGMAKKLLIADALAPIVNQAYDNPELYSGPALILATYCFAFQIYCDFSGYSDLAIGASRVLGFHVPINFNRPYFATNITLFWRRWHISLSSWLRDYLYISLGGSRGTRRRTQVNLMATMLLGGLWHGASWNFVIWGGIHGSALALHKLYLWWRRLDKPVETHSPFTWLVLVLLNFQLVCVTWVFFRAETFGQAISVLRRSFRWESGLPVPWLFPLVLISSLLMVQAVQARTAIIERLLIHPRTSRYLIYFGILLMGALISSAPPVDFIYFVF